MKERLKENRERILMAGLGMMFLVIVVLAGQVMMNNNDEEASEETISQILAEDTESSTKIEAESGADSTDSGNGKVYVDIKGAVRVPGVYEMEDGERVNDVVKEAGGLTAEADQRAINLALKLEDQMLVYIPENGEEVPVPAAGVESSSPEQQKVNLNTADLMELTTLNGIGEKKAEKILQYREENGSFETIEEIMNVSGIGEKTFESLKDAISVSDN